MTKFIKTLIVLWLVFYSHQALADTGRSLRIVSLAPANTEILFALGLDREIVGVSSYCNFPPQALAKDKIGDFSNPNIEKIISLKPDIIFSAGLEQEKAARKLKELGQNVIIIDPSNFAQLFQSIQDIGQLTFRQSQAMQLIGLMQGRINATRQRVSYFNYHPRVFMEIGFNPLMTASKGSFLDEMIKMAGGINIAGDLPRPYCQVSEELVIRQNPEVIVLTDRTKKTEVLKRAEWENIVAVKNNRVYDDINPDILIRPGPRLVDGLEELVKRMYVTTGSRVRGQGSSVGQNQGQK
jgi:iron complex transport system substrate-binding protein